MNDVKPNETAARKPAGFWERDIAGMTAPPPPPPESSLPEQANAAPSNDRGNRLDDAMEKFQDIFKKLPNIFMTRERGLRGCLSALFRPDLLKRRYRTGGIRMLRSSILTPSAIDYLDAATRLANILVPETALARGMKVVRNVALMDDLAGALVNKIQISGSLNSRSALKNLFGPTPPLNLSEYPAIDCDITNVAIAVVFIYKMGQLEPGDSIVLNLRPNSMVDGGAESRKLPPKQVHLVFKYKNVTLTQSGQDYVYNSISEKSPYVIFDVPELQQTVVVYAQAAERAFGERVVCFGGGNACTLYWTKEASYDQQVEWYLQSLSMAVLEHQKYGISVFEGWMRMFDRVYKDPAGMFFDGKTGDLVRRIVTASESGISRAYALVGIPGTGKTHIMEKIMREMPDAVVIDLQSSEYGPSQEEMVRNIVDGCQQRRVLVMADDFDKMMAEKPSQNVAATTGDGSSERTQQDPFTGSKGIIKLFRMLHDIAPGGTAPDGRPLKTFTFVATMNSPKLLNNAIIKRSGRFDEVIDIGIPESHIYGRKLDSIRREGDATNFRAVKFKPLYAYMHWKRITLADTANLYDILCISRKREGKAKFGVCDVFYAVRYLLKNRSNADKDYKI